MHQHSQILLIAEAANPEWASVPLIGWSLYRALNEIAHVHLVTHIRNRDAVLAAGLIEGEDVTIIDNEKVAGPVWKIASKLKGGDGKGWTTLAAFSSLSYYFFEMEVWRHFKDRLGAGEFNLVHRITPLSPTHQSLIARRLYKLGVPFIVGPLNGGVPWPKKFIDRQHAEREWLSHIRGLYKLMPGYRSTLKYSSAIIAGSQHTLKAVPDWAQDKCVYIPENAVDPQRFNLRRTRKATVPLKAAFIGRLVPYKGADILLEAAAEFLRGGRLEIDIVGDGPERVALEELAGRINVADHVRFHGWVPHAKVQSVLASCDFMALPSVREFGGGVVIEAMALGVTPVVADYAGPPELIDEGTGIKVGFDDKQSLVSNFRNTIGALIDAPGQLDKMGAAGLEAVKEKYTWQAKARQIEAVYDAVLAGRKKLELLNVGLTAPA
ncbi:MAG: glycosyltransferase family 4 protein [Hyphomicrobiales bacterium]|nr:glycosyltransferase family 4 protein [Hyphomicrobiales bacterium]